jgi:hypothetical protein
VENTGYPPGGVWSGKYSVVGGWYILVLYFGPLGIVCGGLIWRYFRKGGRGGEAEFEKSKTLIVGNGDVKNYSEAIDRVEETGVVGTGNEKVCKDVM